MANNYQDGWIVALLAMLVPVIMIFFMIAPIYGSALAGLYFVYGAEIFDHWDKYELVINAYGHLYKQWETEPANGFFNFLLPVFGPLVLGVIVTILLIVLFVRYIRSVFTL